MGIGGSLRELAAFIDACEADGQVSAVELGAIEPADGRLTADVAIEVSLDPDDGAVELARTALGDDGCLELAFETTTPAIPTTSHDVTVEPSSTTIAPDGSATVTLTASVPTAGGTDDNADRSADATTAASTAATDAGASNEARTPNRSADDGAAGDSVQTEDSESRRLVAASAGAAGAASGESGRQRSAGDVPPFEDRELLQQVYDEHDTFAEMPAALGMDVTAETVRRYMIDFGIHEPRSYDTSPPAEVAAEATGDEDGTSDEDDTGDAGSGEQTADEQSADERSADEQSADEQSADEQSADEESENEDVAETPVVLADGIGLPEEVTVDTIVETVRESNTIYEVTRDIGVDREAALELLRELDLLEFVVGRLATEAERSISRETVVDRLRQHADAQ